MFIGNTKVALLLILCFSSYLILTLLRVNIAPNFLLLSIVTLHLTRASVGVANAPPLFSSTKSGATTNEFLYINVILSFLKGKLYKLLNYNLFTIIIIFFILIILGRSIILNIKKSSIH